jgi:hypothetical protein
LGLIVPLGLIVGLSAPAAGAPPADDPPIDESTAAAPDSAAVKVELELTIGGVAVGAQQITIRHQPPREGVPEARIIESFTRIDGQIDGQRVSRACRQTARAVSRNLSFTSSCDEGGVRREVQGRRHGDGRWTVIITDAAGSRVVEHRRSAVDLSTLDLYDPVLRAMLGDAPDRRMLIAETGEVVAGARVDLGEVISAIGGAEISVQRMKFEGPGAELLMDWTLDGVPVAWESRLMGHKVVARARALPSTRSFGKVELQTRFDDGQTVRAGEP